MAAGVPIALIAMLTIAVNLVADAFARGMGQSVESSWITAMSVPYSRRRGLRIELDLAGTPIVEDVSLTIWPRRDPRLVGESGQRQDDHWRSRCSATTARRPTLRRR